MTVDTDVERLLEAHAESVAAIAWGIRALLRSEMPDANESVDFGSRLIACGWSMRMRDLLFAVIPHSAHVNLQLADGGELPDPTGIVEGTGKRIRHVKLRTPEDADRDDIRSLIRAQIRVRPRQATET